MKSITKDNHRPNVPSPRVQIGRMMEPVSLGQLTETAPYQGLLDGRIAKGYPTILYGDGAQGKSFMAMALASGVASGKGFGGLPLPQGAALYLDFELSQDEQARRAYRVARGLDLARPPANAFYLSPHKPISAMMIDIRRWVQKYGLTLIVVDSFGAAAGVGPENAEGIIQFFGDLHSLGTSVILLDHQSKLQEGQSYAKKTPFGSTFKFNLSRSVLHLEKVGIATDGIKVVLRHRKNNLGPLCSDLGLSITFSENPGTVRFEAIDMVADPDFKDRVGAEERVLKALEEGPATAQAIAKRSGLDTKTVQNALTKLKDQNKIALWAQDGKRFIWIASRPSKSGGV